MGLNRDNRTVNASKNISSSLINKICILILTLISRRFFILYIGIDYLGINGLFSNVLTLLSVADLGLGVAMNANLYKPIAENDTDKLAALLNYYKHIYYMIAGGVFLFGMILIPFLPLIINMDNKIPHLYLYYIIYVIKTAVSYLFVYKTSIINADQRGYIIHYFDIVLNVVVISVQIICICFFKDYMIYLIIDVLAVLLHNVFVSVIANKMYSFLSIGTQLKKEEKKGLFKDISSAILYRIGGSLLGGTDNICISIIVGTVAVGIYSNYLTITTNIELCIALLFGALTASVGNLIATSSEEKRYETYKTMQMIANWLAAIFSVCLFYLTQEFIILWLKDFDLLLDKYVVIAIAINMFYTVCMRPVWTFREGTGMYRQIRYIMLITAIINIVLSVIMGVCIGIGGILIATTISKFIACFWREPFLLFKNYLGKPPKTYYFAYFKNLVVTIICGLLCLIPIKLISTISILTWIIKGGICCLIVSAVYFIMYRKTPEFMYFVNKIKLFLRVKK